MKQKTCKYCKYWGTTDTDYKGSFDLGKCLTIPMFDDSIEWNKDYSARSIIPKYADTLAFARDGSGYIADLLTKPTFGCVMWKERK